MTDNKRGPVKAYRNTELLTGPDARTVRILCEYLEPRARIRDQAIQRSIIFFGSARTRQGGLRGDDYARAADLAERLARWTLERHPEGQRFHICTGGGPGIMEAAHEGAARVDRSLNVGLNISIPFEQHVNPHVEVDAAFEFHYFFMRKFWFVNLAHGVVVFPGGFGTFDELFELLTLIQTGKSARMPIVLFDRSFWREMINFERLAEEGMISPGDLDLFLLTDSLDEAYDFMTQRVEVVEKDR